MSDVALHQHAVPITIDGRRYEVEEGRRLNAADLLRLAGLSPEGYDLAEVLGHGELREFRDDELVDVHRDEKFVSVRQVAPVA
jgi:hypothetical protein